MSLSKSKYCRAIQCKKMLWLEKNKPEEKEIINNESILETGNEIHEFARHLFEEHIQISFNENLNIMIEDTKKACKTYG